MRADIERVLISREQIAARVAALAMQITADHEAMPDFDGEITIVPILTGAMIFCCDLIRHVPMFMKIGLLTVSSYPGASLRTQGANVLASQLGNLKGRHALVLDDILDSGNTLKAVVPIIEQAGATTVRTAVLLRKNRPEPPACTVDYAGFDIPDEFVVGYGLDYSDYYRNLPDIVTLNRVAIARQA